MLLTVTLSSAAAAALINIWLAIRVGQVRSSQKVSIGDGGNELVTRRMRAHSNFVESAPFVVLLIGAIELAGKGQPWLAYVAAAYFIGRILHGFGMEGGSLGWGRSVGTMATMLTLLGLAIYATLLAMQAI